jgi:hypothetical protein
MKVIRPITITDVMLTSSNVPEADYPEFSLGTTYSPETRVIDTTGVEILTLDVAPATAWIPGRLITGQSSGKTCRIVDKLTTLTYQIRERAGPFTPGEVIGVTGTPAELADQGAAFPKVTPATDKVHKIYESIPNTSLEILTLDVAPSIPWLPNWTLTGQTSLQTCVVVQYIANLTYLVKDRTGAFTLGEVIGVTGTAVLLADQGAANPTFAVAQNVGHYPAIDCLRSDPLWWKEIGATNRWKAFDNKVGSQTSQVTSITYTITPGTPFDSIAFINIDAVSIRIVLTDPVAGVVYDKTVNLLTTIITGAAATMDWYTYFFSSIFKITDFVKLDITPYLNAVLDITITYTGGTAKVGAIVLGLQTNLGIMKYNHTIGIHDYSTKTVDAAGVYSVAAGAFSKRLSCDLTIQNSSLDEIQNLLAFLRANILVWVGSETYSSLIVYGYYKDFSIVVPGPTKAECTLEIEGLT